MAIRFRKRSWWVYLLTLTGCAFFAAGAAGQYVSGYRAEPGIERQPVNASAVTAGPPAREVSAIVSRNIFCSDCAPAPASVPAAAAPSGSEPVRTSLPLRLVATLMGSGEETSFAAVIDTSSGHTRVAAAGEPLSLEARLRSVEQRRILLENAGRLEFLPLEETSTMGGGQPEDPVVGGAAPSRAPAVQGVRVLGEGRYEVQRQALDRALSNTAQLASSARIMPAQHQGKPAGFLLDRIRPTSFYRSLGMQDGDIIQAVNGHSLKTPEDALTLLTGLRRAQHVSISFLRRSRSITHDYTIR